MPSSAIPCASARPADPDSTGRANDHVFTAALAVAQANAIAARSAPRRERNRTALADGYPIGQRFGDQEDPVSLESVIRRAGAVCELKAEIFGRGAHFYVLQLGLYAASRAVQLIG